MGEPLDDCLSKLWRVEDQLLHLKELIDAYEASNPYDIERRDYPPAGKIVFRLREVVPPPPVIPICVGEILHNLRSVLDYLACRLVEETGASADHKTAFPICGTHKEFRSRVAEQLRGIPTAKWKVLEAMQPYNGPDGKDKHPLTILSTLNNLDKHRVLPVCQVNTWGGELVWRCVAPDHSREPGPTLPELSTGAKVVTILIRDGTSPGQVPVDVKLAPGVAFGRECGPVEKHHVFQILLAIRSFLYQCVFVKPGLIEGFDFDSNMRIPAQPWRGHIFSDPRS